MFPTFDAVTCEFLREHSIRAVILDIDNTLEPYENAEPSDRVRAWLDELRNAGIGTAIVSNNNRKRVETFNADIGMPAYYISAKPFACKVRRALRDLGAVPDEALFIGDQIFTDVWAAHNAGIRAVLVPPIKDKTGFLTRFKRWLERPIVAKYRKEHKQ
jgi:HAD superfamily phosphatase (TIGR01668 family)